jgi:hypothetical protein
MSANPTTPLTAAPAQDAAPVKSRDGGETRLPIPAWLFAVCACIQTALLLLGLSMKGVPIFAHLFNTFFIGWDIAFALWTAKVNHDYLG